MRHWSKRLFAIAAPFLLTGCLWGPGKFTSDLTLKKDGSFVLDYRGEIILETAELMKPKPWQDTMAHCLSEAKPRPCSAAELAQQRQAYETKQRTDAETAKSMGLPGSDEESNRAFAAKLMKYAGWHSVTYRGNGVYDVDYHQSGSATQDVVFPLMPDNNLIIPFIVLRRRSDGAVLVNAPALAGGTNMFGPMAQGMDNAGKGTPQSHAQGRFTVHTDGEIVTNNSEDGPSADPLGRQVHWDVAPSSTKLPETLIRL
jgi:hypothetical protein